ncbi:PAP2 superfamily protein [compost metagenome]
MLAAAGWVVAYLLPGWATGAALRLPLPEGFWEQAALLAGGLAVLLLVSVHSSLREQRHASLIASGLSLLLLLGLFIGWSRLTQLDQGLLALIQEQRSASLDSVMVLITRLGDFNTQLAAGVLLSLLLLVARQWRAALFAGGAMLGSALANGMLNTLFARNRPDVLLEPLGSFSFPSGHSSAAFAFFLVLGVLAGRGQPARLRLTWLLLAGLPAMAIALSRVYLGVHWPSDVVAGALLAIGLCALSLSLVQWRTPLTPLPARVWWLILPGCLALLGAIATWQLSEGILLYRY